MTIEQLREAHQERPFKPFTICLADGREIPVPHPEFMLVPPKQTRTFVVALPNGAYKIIDLLLVASLELEDGKAPRRKRRRG